MKRFLLVILALAVLAGGAFAQAKAKFHIGIMTGTVSQSEDDLRGAELLIKLYGDVKSGGMIQHITYPNDFMAQQETVISQIVSLADDPLMKAIIVNEAIPGTAEAYKRVRSKRPDILLLAGEPHEDPLVIQSAADLAVNADWISRGYTIPWAAKQLGAKTFVHISFPRHMSYESLGLRRAIMEEACKDLGMKFAFETAPDPTTEVGVAGAQQFILEKVPQWVEKYGKDTAFFCTNNAHTDPLLKQVAKYGAIFVEPDLPSPLMGYLGAFGVDLTKERGDWMAMTKKVEAAVIAAGGSGRMGNWAFSISYTNSVGLGEFAKNVIEGNARKDSMRDVFAAYGKFTPGAKWNGAPAVDNSTGVRAKNQFLIYQDTYVYGKGVLSTTNLKVPDKYYQIKFSK